VADDTSTYEEDPAKGDNVAFEMCVALGLHPFFCQFYAVQGGSAILSIRITEPEGYASSDGRSIREKVKDPEIMNNFAQRTAKNEGTQVELVQVVTRDPPSNPPPAPPPSPPAPPPNISQQAVVAEVIAGTTIGSVAAMCILCGGAFFAWAYFVKRKQLNKARNQADQEVMHNYVDERHAGATSADARPPPPPPPPA